MRNRIRDEIAAIDPLDELERCQILDVLEWIDSGEELYRLAKPATPPKHLVSYFVVVDETHVLLVDHRNAMLWLPPGGHVESGEHPRDTVKRELEEELGCVTVQPIGAPLMVTVTTTVGHTAGHSDVSLWYVLKMDRSIPIKYDETEFQSIRWFPFAEVPFERADPNLRRFLSKLGSANI